MENLTEKRKKEYLFMAKIRIKATNRTRITLQEIEKLIEISFGMGYDSAKNKFINIEGEDYD